VIAGISFGWELVAPGIPALFAAVAVAVCALPNPKKKHRPLAWTATHPKKKAGR
jgi:hypothetical protein